MTYMSNIPNFAHFKRFYKVEVPLFSEGCPEGRLNTLLYEQFLDCYDSLRISGRDIYFEVIPGMEREPFNKCFYTNGVFMDAYKICVNLLFSPNIYELIPETHYASEPDDNGWMQNLRDFYADAVVSMAYAILYSQSCLPSNAYRLMHFIESRQRDDRYFFNKFRKMAHDEFHTVDPSIDIDWLNFVKLRDDIEIDETRIMEKDYVPELLNAAGSKNQRIRILITIKSLPSYQTPRIQESLNKKIEKERAADDFVKSIFFRDYFDKFYGIDSNGKPLPPSNEGPDDELPDIDLPFQPPHVPTPNKDENTAEINTLKARIAELEKQLEDLDGQYPEQELKPEAFTSQQCCLFFYYIFDKLGLKYEYMNRSAWKRLIWRVANKSPKNIYDNLRIDFDDEQTKKDLVVVADAVRELFPEMASQIDNDKDA